MGYNRGRKALIVLAGFVLAAPSLFAQEDKPKIKIIKNDVNVRISPSPTAEVLKTIPLGTVIDVEETTGDWFRIVVPSDLGINIAGFVRRSDAEIVGGPPPPPPPAKKKAEPSPQDESDKKIIRLKDGSQIKGKILKENPDSLEVETDFGKVTLKREQIAEIVPDQPDAKGKPQEKVPDIVKEKPPETPPDENEIRLGTAPPLKKRVPPQYTALALNQKIQGVVILEVKIDTQGKVKSARVLRSLTGLDKAAVKAVEQWIYEPVVIEGRTWPAVFTVTVDFKLKS